MPSKKEVREALAGIITGERPRNLPVVQQWLDTPSAQAAAAALLTASQSRTHGREPTVLYPIGALPPL
jgi:hypothetical protein